VRRREFMTPQGPAFGSLSKALIVLSDPQHRDFSLRISHLIRENPRFFCAGEPVLLVAANQMNERPISRL